MTHPEANPARLFQNAFYKCSRPLNIILFEKNCIFDCGRFQPIGLFLCTKSHVAVTTWLIYLEFIQWKSTQVSDIYSLNKRVQFRNRQRV